MGSIQLQQVRKEFGPVSIIKGVDLDIKNGEFVVFVGPSGCGKSTLLRLISGLEDVSSGRIVIDGKDATNLGPAQRGLAMVFQSYALFPHLTVFENVAFGLKLKGMRGVELEDKVRGGLKSVGLAEFAGRKPPELSGGQQQRVALARSMVMEPKVLLLDEPLSNLDARLRLEMRTELQRVQRETGVTMIFVTHDQVEALALADRIVVMKNGAIEQIGTPEEIYNAPVSRFVADFVGFENIFELRDGKLMVGDKEISLGAGVPDAAGLAWRPGAVPLGGGPFTGTIRGTSFAGSSREYVLETPIGWIKAETDAERQAFLPGQDIAFDLPVDKAARLERFA